MLRDDLEIELETGLHIRQFAPDVAPSQTPRLCFRHCCDHGLAPLLESLLAARIAHPEVAPGPSLKQTTIELIPHDVPRSHVAKGDIAQESSGPVSIGYGPRRPRVKGGLDLLRDSGLF